MSQNVNHTSPSQACYPLTSHIVGMHESEKGLLGVVVFMVAWRLRGDMVWIIGGQLEVMVQWLIGECV